MHPNQARFKVVDFETTGFDPEKDMPCSFAAVDTTLVEGVGDVFYSLINPGVPIPPETSAIHHITNKDVVDYPSAGDVLCHGVGDQFDFLVAHNAKFDRSFMVKHLDTVKHAPWLCTMRLAKKLWPDDERSNNQYLRYKHEVEVNLPEGLVAHNALYDAVCTAEILRMELREFLSRCKDPDQATVEGIIEWSAKPMLLNTCRFGSKHYGQPWAEVPKSYLSWMMKNVIDMDIDTAHTVQHHLTGSR